MKKQNFWWFIYFLICAFVITMAVKAGGQNYHCHECESAYKDIVTK